MLIFFGGKGQSRLRLRSFMLVVFAVECLIFMGFQEGLRTKHFAALMLTSALVVVAATRATEFPAQSCRANASDAPGAS